MLRRTLVFLLLISLAGSAMAGQFTLLNWNLLNFSSSSAGPRVAYFRTVVQDIAPDIVVTQEVHGQTSANYFNTLVLNNVNPDSWIRAPFYDSYDTDRALFYKDGLLDVIDSGALDTALRDINWWDLHLLEADDTLRIYSVHLKASNTSTDEARRLAEVTVLRDHADLLPAGSHFIVAGDFNMYTAAEDGYGKLLESGPGQFFDPINRPGPWHDSYTFRHIHTQSTRTTSFGGGATGGLDDRFDFVLVCDDLLDATGLEILPDTYTAWGNDGNHLNQSIINGGNSAVTEEVANALHESSDHLPVVVDFNFTGTSVPTVPIRLTMEAWPNPFNPTTRLRFTTPMPGQMNLSIYDIEGRKVDTLHSGWSLDGEHNFTWQPEQLGSGVYLARLLLDGERVATRRLVLIK